MYEKNGKFGSVNLVVHKNETTLGNIIYQFSLAGWHRCNDMYHITRREADQSCEDSYMIISTVAGNGKLMTVDGEYNLVKDSVALVDCRHYCEYHTALGGKWEFYFVHFNQKDMPTFYNYLRNKHKLVANFSGAYQISHAIENIIDIKNSYQSGISFKTSRLIADILYELLDESQESYRPDPLISEIVRYMHEHFSEHVELQDLAEKFYMSKNYLCTLFKQHLNQSPYAYLINIRIQESKKLLVGTKYPLDKVAKLCGFSTPNNFITTYKSIEGITPNKFRKKMDFPELGG